MEIRLKIDELILDGVSPENAANLGRIVEGELENLIRAQGVAGGDGDSLVPFQNREMRVVDGGSIMVPADDRSLGANIARSVYRSLGSAK